MLPDVTKAILPRLWRRKPFLDSSLTALGPALSQISTELNTKGTLEKKSIVTICFIGARSWA
jgi:hypothetical protein